MPKTEIGSDGNQGGKTANEPGSARKIVVLPKW